MRPLFYTLAILFSFLDFAYSGRIVGNGGDIIKCQNLASNKFTVELLDYYESQTLRGLDLDMGPPELDVLEKVDLVLQRLSQFSPQRAKRYQTQAHNFFKEAQFLKNIELVDIPDSNHIVIPKNCQILQIANQNKPIIPGDRRYLIDNNLWEQMDNNHKAGLILHEVIYREGLEWNHQNSISSRYLNGVISSSYIESMSEKEFLDLLFELDFHTIEKNGVLLQIKQQTENKIIDQRPKYYPNGNIKSAFCANNAHLTLNGTKFPVYGPIQFHSNKIPSQFYLAHTTTLVLNGSTYILSPRQINVFENSQLQKFIIDSPTEYKSKTLSLSLIGHIEFYDSGQIRLAEIKMGEATINGQTSRISEFLELHPTGTVKSSHLVDAVKFNINSQEFYFTDNLDLYPSGQVKKGHIKNPQIDFLIQNKYVSFFNYYDLSFYQNGNVQSGYLAKQTTLRMVNGTLFDFRREQKIELTIDGLVKQMTY